MEPAHQLGTQRELALPFIEFERGLVASAWPEAIDHHTIAGTRSGVIASTLNRDVAPI
ncbi:MAG: hypothetical protein ABIO49_12665 [Dokdonella sp.]